MKKPKIAITVSGQTRTHNQIEDQWYSDIEEVFGDFDYDIFGHTWMDQEMPNSKNKFQMMESNDQSMIDTWVSKNLLTHGYTNPMWANDPDWNSKIDNGGARQHILDSSRAAYGQYVSAHLCWDNMAHVAHEYDLIVRYRWDAGIRRNNSDATKSDWEPKVKLLKTEIYNFYLYQNHTREEIVELEKDEIIETPHKGSYASNNSNILVSYPAIINGGDGPRLEYIPDHMFILNPKVVKKIHKFPWEVLLENVITKISPNKPSAHSGWMPFLRELGAIPVVGMPEIHTCIHPRTDNEKEFQHKWGI